MVSLPISISILIHLLSVNKVNSKYKGNGCIRTKIENTDEKVKRKKNLWKIIFVIAPCQNHLAIATHMP